MTESVTGLKARLREEIRGRLALMSPETRRLDSSRICGTIEAEAAWSRASSVLGFVPMAREPDLLPLLRSAASAGRRVCVPRWNPTLQAYEAAELPSAEGLVPGAHGVLEPAAMFPAHPLERLDLVLVPGLAFDRHGSRLGRGRGFYDRLLRQASSASRWGVAFDPQIVDSVPSEPHDVKVHILVTPGLGWTLPNRLLQ
ncbi:MAG: 5-formyltetrahydrofolate cyclo-ligase [Limisphaerales bacterium]